MKIEIARRLWMWFSFGAFAIVSCAYYLWDLRIKALQFLYNNILDNYGAEKSTIKLHNTNAINAIFNESNVKLIIIANIISFIIMAVFWRQFQLYLYNKLKIEYKTLIFTENERKINARAEIHYPPGDIFTLIGISFTFIGLGLGILCVPVKDIFDSATGDAIMRANGAAKSLIIFSYGLMIGICTSLFGIYLAAVARWFAGYFLLSQSDENPEKKHPLSPSNDENASSKNINFNTGMVVGPEVLKTIKDLLVGITQSKPTPKKTRKKNAPHNANIVDGGAKS